MVTVWFGVGQFLSGVMGQLYPDGDINRSIDILSDGIVTSYAWGLEYDSSPMNNKFVMDMCQNRD